MKNKLAKFYWDKQYRHVFNLEKVDVLSIGQLRKIMEEDAWNIRRLLESPDLYQQSLSTRLQRLMRRLLKSHAYYLQARSRKVLGE